MVTVIVPLADLRARSRLTEWLPRAMSPGPLLRSVESTYPTREAPAAADPAFRVLSLRPSLAPGVTRALAALTDGMVRSGRGAAAATAGDRHATSAVVTSTPRAR